MLPQWSVQINGSLFKTLSGRRSMKTAVSKYYKAIKKPNIKTRQTRHKTCIRHTVLVNMPIENVPGKNNPGEFSRKECFFLA